jgi:hypothetical protein
LFMVKCVIFVVGGGEGVVSGGWFVFVIGLLFMAKCVIECFLKDVGKAEVVGFFDVSVEGGLVGAGVCHDRCFDGLTMLREMEPAVADEFDKL